MHCQCEHTSHFVYLAYRETHGYGTECTTVYQVKTWRGTFEICGPCFTGGHMVIHQHIER